MRIGFFLPQIGRAASPRALARVARRVEELGYDSLWVAEGTTEDGFVGSLEAMRRLVPS